MSAQPAYPLRAERGGLAPDTLPDLPRPRMTPAEIPLTLSADVLRLPYSAAQRLVLAEIVSLYAATGCCDASNPHFMARLTLKHDVVNEAIQRFHDDGLVVKVVNKAAGFYRTLTPVPAAIAAKATTNPYPEKSTSYSEKPTSPPSRKSRLGYSGFPTSPSRENPLALVGNPDSNTPFNIPSNFHQYSTPSADASESADEKKTGVKNPADLPALPADASHTRGAAIDVPTSPHGGKPPRAKAAKPGEPADFAPFWQAWPKKEKRQDAVAAFAKLSPDDQAAAAGRADTWLAARPDLLDPTRYRFIPHATTWLNQARWTDQAAPTTASPTTHAAPSPTSYSPRPVNGHKPLGNGGSLARLLAERRGPK